MPHRGVAKVVVIVAVVFVVLLGAAIVIPAMTAVHTDGERGYYAMEKVRGMGNAFTLYYKRFGYFPALTDMTVPNLGDIGVARRPDGQPACLALKLLMQGGFVEDPKSFFSPRTDGPTSQTLDAMQKNRDPRQDPTWYCTYAYDPGHLPNHGSAVFFGDCQETLVQRGHDTAYVLTCEQVAKTIDPNGDAQYVIENHREGGTRSMTDNIYADDSGALGWRDSYLQWDVPAELP